MIIINMKEYFYLTFTFTLILTEKDEIICILSSDAKAVMTCASSLVTKQTIRHESFC